MRIHWWASALLLASSQAAMAAGADPLADALGKFPEMIVTNPDPIQAYFVNMEALQAIARQNDGDQAFAHQRLNFGIIDALTPLTRVDAATWESNAGIALSDVRYFAGFGNPPYMISTWGLSSETVASALFDSLPDRDFEPVGDAGTVGNGEPLAADFTLREVGSPWRDDLGRATFVGHSGDTLFQATTPQAVDMFLAGGDSAADHPVIATAIEALDDITNAGLVVQAMVIAPTFGLQAADFGSIMLSGSTDMDQLRSEIEAEMAAAAKGIPPYFGGIIADVQNEFPALALTLVYPDCAMADTAIGLIEQRWEASMAEIAPGRIQAGTREGVDGLCAAAVTIEAENTAPDANPIARAMFGAFMNRQFTVLQIGEAAE